MLNWRIQIKINGTENENDSMLVKASNLADAKKRALHEIRKRLPDKKNLYLESIEKGYYTVVSNFDDVGVARIEHFSE